MRSLWLNAISRQIVIDPKMIARRKTGRNAAMVGLEFINMMTAVGRLNDAGVLLGHFDATGLLGVEGPGFRLLIADAVDVVAADRDATTARDDAATRKMDEPEALAHMRDVLRGLIEQGEEPMVQGEGTIDPL